jgi:hypothetical protein
MIYALCSIFIIYLFVWFDLDFIYVLEDVEHNIKQKNVNEQKI